jgi:6-pyruvoyltetrahydropterin/6-carboxytetrahydropterin synthase
MFELTVEREFQATHAITIAGVPETPHEHRWLVAVVVGGDRLDDDGLLCDFHEIERAIDAVIDPFRGGDLNAITAFNPTAENMAKHIADTIKVVGLRSVSVTEAPGCTATVSLRRQ